MTESERGTQIAAAREQARAQIAVRGSETRPGNTGVENQRQRLVRQGRGRPA